MKGFRKKISILLLIVVLLSFSMSSVARDLQVSGLNEKYYIATNDISEALNNKGNYKIIINEENRDKVYKQLGINRVMAQKDNTILKNEVIYVEEPKNEIKRNMFSNSSLPDYNGMPMKIAYSYGERHYDVETIYQSSDLKRRIIKDTLSKAVSICLGLLPKWVWIPDSLLGLSSAFFKDNCAFGNTFNIQVDAGETTKIVLVKDVDNLFDEEWYGMVAVESCNFKLEVALNYVDYKDMQPQKISTVTRKTIGCEHYNNDSYLQEYAYNCYKGNPGYTDMLIEVVPEPEVDGVQLKRVDK